MGLTPHIPTMSPTGPPGDLIVILLQILKAHVDWIGKVPGCLQHTHEAEELVDWTKSTLLFLDLRCEYTLTSASGMNEFSPQSTDFISLPKKIQKLLKMLLPLPNYRENLDWELTLFSTERTEPCFPFRGLMVCVCDLTCSLAV